MSDNLRLDLKNDLLNLIQEIKKSKKELIGYNVQRFTNSVNSNKGILETVRSFVLGDKNTENLAALAAANRLDLSLEYFLTHEDNTKYKDLFSADEWTKLINTSTNKLNSFK